MAAHAIYAAHLTSKPVCVVADDTDVFILLFFVSDNTNVNIYFRQGTKASKAGVTYHNVTKLADTPGAVAAVGPVGPWPDHFFSE